MPSGRNIYVHTYIYLPRLLKSNLPMLGPPVRRARAVPLVFSLQQEDWSCSERKARKSWESSKRVDKNERATCKGSRVFYSDTGYLCLMPIPLCAAVVGTVLMRSRNRVALVFARKRNPGRGRSKTETRNESFTPLSLYKYGQIVLFEGTFATSLL